LFSVEPEVNQGMPLLLNELWKKDKGPLFHVVPFSDVISRNTSAFRSFIISNQKRWKEKDIEDCNDILRVNRANSERRNREWEAFDSDVLKIQNQIIAIVNVDEMDSFDVKVDQQWINKKLLNSVMGININMEKIKHFSNNKSEGLKYESGKVSENVVLGKSEKVSENTVLGKKNEKVSENIVVGKNKKVSENSVLGKSFGKKISTTTIMTRKKTILSASKKAVNEVVERNDNKMGKSEGDNINNQKTSLLTKDDTHKSHKRYRKELGLEMYFREKPHPKKKKILQFEEKVDKDKSEKTRNEVKNDKKISENDVLDNSFGEMKLKEPVKKEESFVNDGFVGKGKRNRNLKIVKGNKKHEDPDNLIPKMLGTKGNGKTEKMKNKTLKNEEKENEESVDEIKKTVSEVCEVLEKKDNQFERDKHERFVFDSLHKSFCEYLDKKV
jgi:hypothetical protein